jgi:hypothetical protein
LTRLVFRLVPFQKPKLSFNLKLIISKQAENDEVTYFIKSVLAGRRKLQKAVFVVGKSF